jgi:hypothetical protein
MAHAQSGETNKSDIAIFGRLLSEPKGNMSPELARYVLTLGFTDADQSRMRDLATRNQQGALSGEEHEELMSYVKVVYLLALVQSKARKALKKRKVS